LLGRFGLFWVFAIPGVFCCGLFFCASERGTSG
jgi:hypothetical protein